MKQAIFDWVDNTPPAMDNFVQGENSEVWQVLHTDFSVLVLWGQSGSGKTHLLKAWLQYYSANNGVYVTQADDLFRLPENISHIAFDNIHLYNDTQWAKLFALFNQFKDSNTPMLFASDKPPAALTLREDLKTRLNWGGVYEVKPLSDNDKMHALRQLANERQMYIDDAVFEYLMNFVSRDMRTLCTCLIQFDDFAVEQKRRMTVPLLKVFLKTMKK